MGQLASLIQLSNGSSSQINKGLIEELKHSGDLKKCTACKQSATAAIVSQLGGIQPFLHKLYKNS